MSQAITEIHTRQITPGSRFLTVILADPDVESPPLADGETSDPAMVAQRKAGKAKRMKVVRPELGTRFSK